MKLAWETLVIKELASEDYPQWRPVSKLYLAIYSLETIKKIFEYLDKLKKEWWYTAIFTMNNTWKSFLWRTLNNTHFDWNIRTAVEVSVKNNQIKDYSAIDDPLIKVLENEKNWTNIVRHCNKFWFHETVSKFKKLCDVIVKWKVDNQLEEVLKFAVMWDTFFDEWYYWIKWWDWENLYINKQFILSSPYESYNEVEMALRWRRFNDEIIQAEYMSAQGEIW